MDDFCSTQSNGNLRNHNNVTNHTNKASAVYSFLAPIQDKFEVIDKLNLLPIEEVQEVSQKFVQQLDKICMDKITQRVLQKDEKVSGGQYTMPTASIAKNSVVSHPTMSQLSVDPRCSCQSLMHESENPFILPIANTMPKVNTVSKVRAAPIVHTAPIVNPAPKLNPEPRERRPARANQAPNPLKALQVVQSDEENESILSFFKKNQKKTKKENNPAASTETVDRKTKLPAKDVIQTPVIAAGRPGTSKGLDINFSKPQPVNNSKLFVCLQKITEETKESKRKPARPAEETKKRTKTYTEPPADLVITKQSLRNSVLIDDKKEETATAKSRNLKLKNNRTTKKKNPAPRTSKDDSVYEHSDDGGMFGDVSSIVGGLSFQDSGINGGATNFTKISTNRTNDINMHIFAQLDAAQGHSVCGVSAVSSTPLSKTLPKLAMHRRLKRPDVGVELKPVKSRKTQKGTLKKADMVSLNHEEDSSNSENETTDFSDMETE